MKSNLVNVLDSSDLEGFLHCLKQLPDISSNRALHHLLLQVLHKLHTLPRESFALGASFFDRSKHLL